MQIINFIGICTTPEGHSLWSLLTQFVVLGFDYERDVVPILKEKGVYLPKDQYEALVSLIDIQIELDIGDRQQEVASLFKELLAKS